MRHVKQKIYPSKFVAILLVLVVIFSSSTIPVRAAENDNATVVTSRVLGDTWNGLAEGEILIKDTITKITDGVIQHEVISNRATGDQQKIDYIAEVEMSDTIKLVAGYGNNDGTRWSLTSTTDQAAAYEKDHPGETVVAAINADFFNMATGEPLGALVMEGQEYHSASGRNYFGVTKSGEAVIRSSSDLSDLQMAVGGDAILVKDGAIVEENGAYGALQYSRCAIGIMEDGTVVTFTTYGLRAPISCGRTYEEIAQMMCNAGCVDVLALDGGGSATFCSRPEGTEELLVSNSPGDGAEREVSSTVLIVSTAEATGIFDHAALKPNNEVYTPGSEIQFQANGVDTAGMPMAMPEGVSWTLDEQSAEMGSIDSDTGVFTSNEKCGQVTVNLIKDEHIIGTTSISIAVPDQIYFANEEASLGFEDTTDFGLVVRNAGRDLIIKDGDIVWTSTNEAMGTFDGNTFTSSDGESLNGDITATSKWDNSVYGTIHVIVGMLPTIVWDFEDVALGDADIIAAEDYYVNGYTIFDPAVGENVYLNGILTHSNYGRGGNESIEIVSIDNDEPVRFGEKALKLNYDFINCGAVTEGACVGTTNSMSIPGVPTGIGVWVYAPEGMGITYEGPGTQSGFWLRGYVRDGNGSNQPYDFTLEPKACVDANGNWNGVQPGIYWEGWMYLEADLTHLASPYSIQSGMTFRLMYVAGTMMGTKSAGSVYFDNLQFVYGTNVDDIDAPIVDSITINGEELVDGMTINTNTIDVTSIFHDVENKYTTGIDTSTVRMFVDGVNVVDNQKYQYVLSPDGTMNYLYGLELPDGVHTITVSLRDGFGNDVSETRSFIVETGILAETTVNVIPVEDTAILGKTVSLNIVASDDSVTESTTFLRLGNLFPDYQVTFNENYEGTYSYSKMTGQLTINATKKEVAVIEENEECVIATIAVQIPVDLTESALFSYEVKGGYFTTSNDYYATYSERVVTLPVGAEYIISADAIIIGQENATLKVNNSKGEPAAGVTIYLACDNSVIGVTDENGQLVTDYFNSASGKYTIYAKDDTGLLSFQYNVGSYDPAGEVLPYNIRFNAPDDPATQKSISWISNPLSSEEQYIRYAVSGTENWTTVTANTEQFTFTAGGNITADFNNVTLKNLSPSTTYDYQVGFDETWTEVDTFTTDDGDTSSAKFFVLGDIQADDLTNISTIRDILKAEDYDFGIQTGDAIDNPDSYFGWEEYTGLFNADTMGDVNMIQVLGNHELVGEALGSKAMFDLPASHAGSCYSRTYGNVYMAVINYTSNSTQLRNALDWMIKDAQASSAEWKLLLMHQPAYYTNSTGGNAEIYAMVPNAVEEAGIDVVFSGHDHSAARTNPLKDDQINEKDGALYYICGSSGEKSYSITTQDKFDYETIFALATIDFNAIYLTAEATEDALTINMYDLNTGVIDTYTMDSECIRKGHQNVYDKAEEKVYCTVCDEIAENYTGDVFDEEENEYYLLNGVMQTEWVVLGEEIRYYNPETGIREELLKDETPSTCIIDGHCIYTSESGAQKRIEYTDAGGHEYDEQEDGSFVCSKCGHVRVAMQDCDVTLSYDQCTYTGVARTPATKAVAPDGTVLTKTGDYRDYYSTYTNNVEVGTASVTLTARKYGVYVNMNDWRGNCSGSVTVNYAICPDLPKNIRVVDDKEMLRLVWDAAKATPTYVVLASSDGENWNEIETTEDTSLVLDLDKYDGYMFKIRSRMVVDGKTYESINDSTEVSIRPVVTTGNREADGKPTLKWKALKNVENYDVYRSTTENGVYTKVFTSEYLTYTHTSATVGKTYYYKVIANYKDGTTSLFSEVISNSCMAAKPVVTIELDDYGMPTLAWKSVTGAEAYDVYRAELADGDYKKISNTATVNYVDNTAKKDLTYYYKIVAVRDNENISVFSDVVDIVCKSLKPEPVTDIRYVDGKPTLKWEAVEGATSYQVYRSVSKNGTYVKVFTTTGTTYTHASAEVGNTYYYKVKTVLNNGNEIFSDIVTAKCDNGKFVVTPSVRAIDGKPTLKWNLVEGAVSYQVYRSTSENGTYTKVFTTTGTTYTHASSVIGNTYYYKVKVVYSDGRGVFGSVVNATCEKGQFDIVVGNNGAGKPTLKWNKDEMVKQYQIYRSTSENGSYVRVFITTGGSYTHVSATVDGKYYYKVKAVLTNESVVYSEVVSNTALCGKATVVAGNSSEGKPTLKWDAVDGATKYQVYRATSEDGKYVCVFTTTGKTYTHVSAVEGNTYYYKVCAVSENGTSGLYSDIITNTCF